MQKSLTQQKTGKENYKANCLSQLKTISFEALHCFSPSSSLSPNRVHEAFYNYCLGKQAPSLLKNRTNYENYEKNNPNKVNSVICSH